MDVCVQCSGLLKVLKMMMLIMVLLLMVLKMMIVVSLTGEALFGSLFGIFLYIC